MPCGLIIDLFAGGGGASTGLTWALGHSPDIAINHDAEALAMHAANHPGTLHLCANVLAVNPLYATDDQPVDGLVVANGSGTWGVSAAATSGNGGMEEWSHLPIIDGKVGEGVKFERIRRITGYLVGTVERFNNAKRAEVRDRVKHMSMTPAAVPAE